LLGDGATLPALNLSLALNQSLRVARITRCRIGLVQCALRPGFLATVATLPTLPWARTLEVCLMRPLKGFVTVSAAVLSLAALSTSANAGYVGAGPFGAMFGVGPNNNGLDVGAGPQSNDGFGLGQWMPTLGLGENPQQNIGILNPMGFGFPGSNFGPFSWGMDPRQNANLGLFSPYWGMNPQQNVGLLFPPHFGIGSQQNVGLAPPPFGWGMNPQQNVGIMPSPAYFGMSPQQNVGLAPPPFGWGMGPQQNFGVPSIPGPMVWGMGPWMPSLGMNPQQSLGWYTSPVMGMNPQQNVGLWVPPFMGINPNGSYPAASQMPYPAQAGAQPVQCSINNVAALTKSVDDCEKAGGDVPSSKSADAAKK
jgi:hypothetical protein